MKAGQVTREKEGRSVFWTSTADNAVDIEALVGGSLT
jgi:hypothetical protein